MDDCYLIDNYFLYDLDVLLLWVEEYIVQGFDYSIKQVVGGVYSGEFVYFVDQVRS